MSISYLYIKTRLPLNVQITLKVKKIAKDLIIAICKTIRTSNNKLLK